MKFLKRQYTLDFEQPIWDNDPELLVMHQILDHNLAILMLAAPCFPKACDEVHAPVGRDGMTLEQIVRCAIYHRYKGLTWRQLSDHTEDSKKGRLFMKMEYGQYFSFQALQENVSKITPEILAKIHQALCQYAVDERIDDGKKVRTDSTGIKTNIHFPTNASLLWDCIRVASRLVKRSKSLLQTVMFRSYEKIGKKLLYKIVNTKGEERRLPFFRKMIKQQESCIVQVQTVIECLSSQAFDDPEKEIGRQELLEELKSLLPQMKQIADVAFRREILGEKVKVQEKLFSIFESHTDCIVKGKREPIFGHKVNFTSGASGLIFDCIIKRGNPADSSYYQQTIENLQVNYNITPNAVAADGAYASLANLDYAKQQGVVNIVFSKVRGSLQNHVSSAKMETMLKKWRAGIEATISNFKRGLHASLCTWKGWEGFKSFVLWCVITFNLRVMARSIIAKLA